LEILELPELDVYSKTYEEITENVRSAAATSKGLPPLDFHVDTAL
jgi:hypothetical protein